LLQRVIYKQEGIRMLLNLLKKGSKFTNRILKNNKKKINTSNYSTFEAKSMRNLKTIP
jgi:hypothetical protein